MTIVDQVFFLILDLLNEGFDLVMPIVLALFAMTFGSALVRLAFGWLAGSMENMVGDLIGLLVVFWIFFTFAFAAQEITDAAGKFALAVGSGIVGADTMTAEDFGPSALWSVGEGQAASILATKRALCTGTWECMKTVPEQLLLEFGALCIYGAFAFLIFEMAMTILGYKVNSLFMLIFTPMAVLPFTKSFSEGAIQGTVNHLVKLTIIAMVAGIASQAFELMELPPKPVFDDIIPAILLAVFVAFLAWQSRVLASGIISAVPQLSGQAITRAVGNTMRAAATGAGAATSAAMLGNREKATIAAAASGIAAGAQRAPARLAAATAAVKSGASSAQGYWQKVKAANSNAGVSRKATGTPNGSGGGGSSQRESSASASAPTAAQEQPAASNDPAPARQHEPDGHRNDGRFMASGSTIANIGGGGGWAGTGYHGQNWNGVSVRKQALATLTGEKAANAEKMAMAVMREVHFGKPARIR